MCILDLSTAMVSPTPPELVHDGRAPSKLHILLWTRSVELISSSNPWAQPSPHHPSSSLVLSLAKAWGIAWTLPAMVSILKQAVFSLGPLVPSPSRPSPSIVAEYQSGHDISRIPIAKLSQVCRFPVP